MAIPIFSAILDIIKGPIDKLIPDKNKAAEMQHEVAMAVVNSDLAQMAINAEEAKHPSVFVSGWRPGAGWICVIALGLNYLILPIGKWYCAIWHPDIVPPNLDQGELMTLLFGMLGMGGLRTLDKMKGVSRSSI